jgi:hypothetical protein
MGRQSALGEVDAPAIEKLAVGRRITVLSDADRRGSLRSFSRHDLL